MGRRFGTLAWPVLAAALLAGCATAPAAPAPRTLTDALAYSIDSITAAPPAHRATWGILIREAASGAVLYGRNAEQLLIPASNMKLVVTTVALGRLGPDWRFETEVRAAPAVAGVSTTVVVTGAGDPTWSARFYDGVGAPFDSLASIVTRAAPRGVADLVIDVSRFRDEPIHPTWEVSDLPGVFAPPVDAFAAGEGTFRLALSGGPAPGMPGTATVVPPLHQPVRATVTTDTAGARPTVSIDFLARRDTVYLTARVGAGANDTTTHAVTRPAESASAALAAALRARGVAVGRIRLVRDSVEAAELRARTAPVGALRSVPLIDIVAAILRPSQNWISEQLAKALGALLAGEGSWRGGNDVQRHYLVAVAGVDSTAFQLRDASGMSAQNLLSPVAALALLDHARRQPWGSAYRTAMAQPGLAGSTLATRLLPLEGRLHAKTGTITNVNSLSGYFTAADGREILFAVLTNGSGAPAAAMRAAIDDVVMAMARHLDATPQQEDR